MYRESLKKIFFTFLLFLLLIVGLNYFVDPYGYKSREGKYVKNLTMFNKPDITNARIQSNGYYYLIGSSRMARVDPRVVEVISGKPSHNLKIDGATFLESALLASQIKRNNKYFIYSFDAFSLNSYRSNFNEIKNRSETYRIELDKKIFFKKYFNSDITIRSIQHLSKQLKGEKKDKHHLEENSRFSSFSYDTALKESGILNNKDKSNFSNYDIYSLDKVQQLAKLGTKNDIFIIFPKYFNYYEMFNKYQDIQELYFSAVKVLVENTNAKVWSFYGLNDITLSENNFIDNGWHFKPWVSNIMFNEVFKSSNETSEKKSAVLLTAENIDEHLSNLRDELASLTKKND